MSDLKQEALEAAIRAYGPSYSDHTHQLDLSAACEAYYEALRAGEATAFQVTDEAIDGAIGAYDAWDSKWEAMRHALNSFAQRPAQPAGVGCPVVPVDDGAVMARQLVEKELREAVASWRRRATEAERELAECREDNSKMHESYLARIGHGNDLLFTAESEVERLKVELAGELAENEAYRTAADVDSRVLVERGGELEALSAKLDEADAELERVRAEYQAYRAEASKLADDYIKLTGACNEANAARGAAEAKLTEANALIDALNTDCAAFQHDRACAEAREKRLREYAGALCMYEEELEQLADDGWVGTASAIRKLDALLKGGLSQLAEPERAKQPAKSEPVSVPDELPKPGDVLTGEQAKAYLLSVPGAMVRQKKDRSLVYGMLNGGIAMIYADGSASHHTDFANHHYIDHSYIVLPPATPEPSPSEAPNGSVTLDGLAKAVRAIAYAVLGSCDQMGSLTCPVPHEESVKLALRALATAEGEG